MRPGKGGWRSGALDRQVNLNGKRGSNNLRSIRHTPRGVSRALGFGRIWLYVGDQDHGQPI